MPTVFVPFPTGIVEAILPFIWGGIPGEITLGFRNLTGDAPTDTEVGNLMTALQDWIAADYVVFQSSTLTWQGVQINELLTPDGRTWSETTILNADLVAASVPQNVAMTVTFKTGLLGRSHRGRNYVPGLCETQLDNPRTWTDALASDVNDAYAAMQASTLAEDWTHVVLSRFADKAPRDLGDSERVTSYRANTQVHTLRSRLT